MTKTTKKVERCRVIGGWGMIDKTFKSYSKARAFANKLCREASIWKWERTSKTLEGGQWILDDGQRL